MSLDEYETIRLIDLEQFTQEDSAIQMNIARTTVQSIYAEARKKIAICLIQGKPLYITGGNIRLCEENKDFCGRGCRRNRNRHMGGETL
jgi:predicted DNA-binding protein (UPF0251 family)